jgi:hypothetical protein
MTVAELIAWLQRADPTLNVIIGDYDPRPSRHGSSHGPLRLTIERPDLHLESSAARSSRTYDYKRNCYRDSGFEEVPQP